ncbi:hypothetical protein PV332_10430 [Streptomyces scabiei]|uniref:hypothetical protein n=1 Tax=Streptomyces scabiei TaxID=1930 RepID=UPI0029BA7C5D|nr:hypothetical protein [Streptomyces scabiei]MDX2575896.1 hypothetical protein [Streptomyces scabiei]MDX2885631.1 hypothetical protein [Streptomyces scabiei]MDX2997637.1 hypothetical protein [Streptomyces scabiei]MDX3032942.1 hypothetical protein [Streptomyces scabiei]MDX3051283.1 hypothetical protein [Streptomyces scabiei]
MTETTPSQAQENEATEQFGTATLCGSELRVKAVNHWRPSYMRALRTSDFETWAAGVLHEDDVQTFIDLDATFEEINTFVGDAMESAGEEPGKSSGRARSSTRTRKR